MLYTLQNKELTVTVASRGAELISVKRGDCDYIWDGNPDYWTGHAPLVFPVCGRFQDSKYDYDGKTYEIACHGFVRPSEFVLSEQTDTSITLTLLSDEKTRAVYPFEFVLHVTYTLKDSTLSTSMRIENPGKVTLPATLGFHPAFRVPLGGKGAFEDYYLEFGEECYPDMFLLSERCLGLGEKVAYPLEESKYLRLRHDLFDNDAIFLSRMSDSVTLKSDTCDRSVTLKYEGIPYLGVWHTPKTDAPFVCIEPFCGLMGLDGVREDLSTRPDTFRILPGHEHTETYSATFG